MKYMFSFYAFLLIISAGCGSGSTISPTGVYIRVDSNQYAKWTDSLIIEAAGPENTYNVRKHSNLPTSSPEIGTATYNSGTGVLDLPGLKIIVDHKKNEARINQVTFQKMR